MWWVGGRAEVESGQQRSRAYCANCGSSLCRGLVLEFDGFASGAPRSVEFYDHHPAALTTKLERCLKVCHCGQRCNPSRGSLGGGPISASGFKCRDFRGILRERRRRSPWVASIPVWPPEIDCVGGWLCKCCCFLSQHHQRMRAPELCLCSRNHNLRWPSGCWHEAKRKWRGYEATREWNNAKQHCGSETAFQGRNWMRRPTHCGQHEWRLWRNSPGFYLRRTSNRLKRLIKYGAR